MRFPLNDWQFYVVTALALSAIWLIVRPFLPSRRTDGSCPTCASGSAAKRKRTKLTISGKRV